MKLSSILRIPEAVLSSRERFIALALLLIAVLAVVVSVAAIPRVGISWDAGMHTYGALDTRQIEAGSNLAEAYDQIYGNLEFYGVLIQWSADAIHLLFGGQGFLQPDALLTYRMQSVVVIAVNVVSAALTGWVMGILMKSVIPGLFVGATIVSLPFIMGHSLVNAKDLPTASGLLMVSAGSALTFSPSGKRRAVLATALVFVGTFIALGVRIGSWPLVGAVLIFSGATAVFVSVLIGDRKAVMAQVLVPVTGVALALLGTFLINPLARIDMFGWLRDSFVVARAYPWEGSIRTWGQDVVSTDLPMWYVPAWLAAQTPILVLLFVGVGVIYWFVRFTQALKHVTARGLEPMDGSVLALTPFAIQAVLIPMAMVTVNATLYDGIRHVAFAVPALIALSAPLVKGLLAGSEPKKTRHVFLRVGVAVLIVAVPISGLIGSIRWFPYMYAHVNWVTAALEHDGERQWEYDYWGTTIVEGTQKLRDLGVSKVVVTPPIDITGSNEVLELSLPRDVGADEEYGLYVFRRWYASIPSEGCREVFAISRGGVLLGQGAICRGESSLMELSENVREPRTSM